MDVRLDEPVPIADADGHHGVDCDPVRGKMTAEKHSRNRYSQDRLSVAVPFTLLTQISLKETAVTFPKLSTCRGISWRCSSRSRGRSPRRRCS